MCGIFCAYSILSKDKYTLLIENAELMNYRGESTKQMVINNKCLMWHRRLAIMDTTNRFADQPFSYKGVFCIVNGEIYNYEYCRKIVEHTFRSGSDCEVIIPMYLKYGTQFVGMLQGMFSFALYDSTKDLLIAGRDHIGMTSLYYGKLSDTDFVLSSDLKSIDKICTDIVNVPAGHVFIKSKNGQSTHSYYSLPKETIETPIETVLETIREKFINTVKSHLTSDVPIGVLLSGGLDSSLVAAVASRLSKDTIKTFTIGVEDSSDVLAADKVADFIKSDHTAYNFEAVDAPAILKEVIYAIETYDLTTVRASIPLYLLTKWIRADTGIKVILSGEVSDEIFAGYSYFKYAPSSNELLAETRDKVSMLQRYDCLRAHKATIANTIEIRIPFGDQHFVDYVMSIDPKYKMYEPYGIEKYILRKAFEGYLPDEILWRKKEQFSDGVSSEKENVISVLKQFANDTISDEEFEKNKGPTITKEGYLYYKTYKELFNSDSTVDNNVKSVACSTARALKWLNISEDSPMNDPSGHSC